jgi:gliding motility-associated-like protein
MQIMDTNRCYRRDTVSVIVSVRNPQVGPKADTAICFGDHVALFATGGTNYQWYPATGLSCTNCANPIATPTTTTTYHVVVFDQYGCNDTLSVRIVVHPLPVITLGADTTIIWGETVQLNAYVPGGLYYLWDPVTGLNNANIPNPLATPQVTTIYTLVAIDTNLCKSTDSMKVTVRTDIPVAIPSAFSPNGDGKNDVFHIANLKFQKLVEFRVFNRWGQEIFSTNDNAKGWDGSYKGREQETGVYNYIIRVAWPDGHVETYKGDVTLVR